MPPRQRRSCAVASPKGVSSASSKYPKRSTVKHSALFSYIDHTINSYYSISTGYICGDQCVDKTCKCGQDDFKGDYDGNIDIDDLKEKIEIHKQNLSALMITYPSTHGVFEEKIIQITTLIISDYIEIFLHNYHVTFYWKLKITKCASQQMDCQAMGIGPW